MYSTVLPDELSRAWSYVIQVSTSVNVATLVYQTRIIKEAAVLEVLTLSSIPSADTSEPDLLETAAARALARAERQHQPFIPHIGSGTSNKMVFDLAKEQERGRAYIGPFYAGPVCTKSGSTIDIGVFTNKQVLHDSRCEQDSGQLPCRRRRSSLTRFSKLYILTRAYRVPTDISVTRIRSTCASSLYKEMPRNAKRCMTSAVEKVATTLLTMF